MFALCVQVAADFSVDETSGELRPGASLAGRLNLASATIGGASGFEATLTIMTRSEASPAVGRTSLRVQMRAPLRANPSQLGVPQHQSPYPAASGAGVGAGGHSPLTRAPRRRRSERSSLSK